MHPHLPNFSVRANPKRQVVRRLCTLLFFCLVPTALATHHFIRINEVMAGLNGDSGIQFGRPLS